VPVGEQVLTVADVARVVAPLLAGGRGEQFESRPDLDFAYSLPEKGRFRINLYRQRTTFALVARRIKAYVPTIDELGLPEVLKRFALLRQGLVCVTGATGSGKSTTLAAMIDHRNASLFGHILTIEDPIEFLHLPKRAVISQREVGTDTATFEDALRSALRQAPDLLLLGEIRDAETAEAALHFAETGHVVLATVHATNAAQTFDRIVNLFPGEKAKQIFQLLALNLGGVVTQRLIPTAQGNDRCAALEILVPTARIRDLVKQGEIQAVTEAMFEARGQDGMQTFDDALYALVTSEKITENQAVTYADSPNDLRLRFKQRSAPSADDLEGFEFID
jgi:twitching motility protein PilU